jgi:hypothetical protein
VIPINARLGNSSRGVQVGTVALDDRGASITLTALPSPTAVLRADIAGIALGPEMLRALSATEPVYGKGRAASVTVWREGAEWCASRGDDATVEQRGGSLSEVLRALADRLEAEAASVCDECRLPVLTCGHDRGCARDPARPRYRRTL